MTACVARETSSQYLVKVDPPFEIETGPCAGYEVNGLNVWIHRPGDPWSYKVWVDDGVDGPVLVRTKASLEHYFPGLFDAVVIPVMSDPKTNQMGQHW